jgi:DNA polymerase I-like protein with 3'-5' exonuclease and polymerase domains
MLRMNLHDELVPGSDPHAELAARLFGVPVGAVSPEQRRYAKQMNFMPLYAEPGDLACKLNPSK